jgi:hypothetical protein
VGGVKAHTSDFAILLSGVPWTRSFLDVPGMGDAPSHARRIGPRLVNQSLEAFFISDATSSAIAGESRFRPA